MAREAQVERQGRMGVDIPVTVISVLESTEAAIANLNEDGALIQGCALAVGARVQIDYRGQILYAHCRWAEIDRMGVKFVQPLADGPLFEQLLVARTPGETRTGTTVMPFPIIHARQQGGERSFGRALHGGFGRRAG
ncbi:MAG TPA: PilZ domain-containing protein [Sphingobium sp.]|nr:PilZ domain-containing protein [Sphingobium sp.]